MDGLGVVMQREQDGDEVFEGRKGRVRELGGSTVHRRS